MMSKKWLLPVLALALAGWSVWNVFGAQRDTSAPRKPSVALPRSPGGDRISAAGIVEPYTESSGTATVPVGSPVAGLVDTVGVKPGQVVKEGDVLFTLDGRPKAAELAVKE